MKAINATCSGGTVTADGLPVPGAAVLSEGVSESSGLLFLDEDLKAYVAKTSPDLKTTLEKLASALTAIASALSTIDSKPTGTLPPAPGASGNIATINSLQSDLNTLKDALR